MCVSAEGYYLFRILTRIASVFGFTFCVLSTIQSIHLTIYLSISVLSIYPFPFFYVIINNRFCTHFPPISLLNAFIVSQPTPHTHTHTHTRMYQASYFPSSKRASLHCPSALHSLDGPLASTAAESSAPPASYPRTLRTRACLGCTTCATCKRWWGPTWIRSPIWQKSSEARSRVGWRGCPSYCQRCCIIRRCGSTVCGSLGRCGDRENTTQVNKS